MHVHRRFNFRRQKCDQERRSQKIRPYNSNKAHVEWLKTKVMPVVTGATGRISKPFRKYLSNIEGNHKIKNYKKAILGTVHTFWKVLMYNYTIFNKDNNITCSINCK
jgi:hypothetical protein